jgi:hypothetical protein
LPGQQPLPHFTGRLLGQRFFFFFFFSWRRHRSGRAIELPAPSRRERLPPLAPRCDASLPRIHRGSTHRTVRFP